MTEYHKIQSVYKRDEKTKRFIEGEWSLPEFGYLKDLPWVFTEKVDGTNIRVMWNGENVIFGGKTENAQIPVPLLYALQAMFEGTENKRRLKECFGDATDVCIYGEGFGGRIQSGSAYLDEPSFVLFDVKIGTLWLERENVNDVAVKLGITSVPVIGEGTLSEAIAHVRTGFVSTWYNGKPFTAEGIVARPKVELLTRRGERIITKIKHRDFS